MIFNYGIVYYMFTCQYNANKNEVFVFKYPSSHHTIPRIRSSGENTENTNQCSLKLIKRKQHKPIIIVLTKLWEFLYVDTSI